MTEYRVRCARSSTEGHRLEIYPRRDRDAAEGTCAALNELERRYPHGCAYIVESREVTDWAPTVEPQPSLFSEERP